MSGDEHPAFRKLLREAVAYGRMPRWLSNSCNTEAEMAERNLRRRIRRAGLETRIQEELNRRSRNGNPVQIVRDRILERVHRNGVQVRSQQAAVIESASSSTAPQSDVCVVLNTNDSESLTQRSQTKGWMGAAGQSLHASVSSRGSDRDTSPVKGHACSHASIRTRPGKMTGDSSECIAVKELPCSDGPGTERPTKRACVRLEAGDADPPKKRSRTKAVVGARKRSLDASDSSRRSQAHASSVKRLGNSHATSMTRAAKKMRLTTEGIGAKELACSHGSGTKRRAKINSARCEVGDPDVQAAKDALQQWERKQGSVSDDARKWYDQYLSEVEFILSRPRRGDILKQRAASKELTKDGSYSDWWQNANVRDQGLIPKWCNGTGGKGKVSVQHMMYSLSHELLLDIQNFISWGAYRIRKVLAQRQQYLTFFQGLRSSDRLDLAPYPEHLHSQPGIFMFRPFQWVRQLALIELVDLPFIDLPKDYEALLHKIREKRIEEKCQCRTVSDMLQMSISRLVQYGRDPRDAYMNARFLHIHEPSCQGDMETTSKVEDLAAAETRLAEIVNDFKDVLEKENIDVTSFKPNQFAALSVYYAKFLRFDDSKTHNWINRRYCTGLKQYVPGSAIEAEAGKKRHLASQCMPSHYTETEEFQGEVVEQSGQAIATAPVTCELCHQGFSGYDKFDEHCRREHQGYAEYRKRTFYKAREEGMRPLLPCVKRQMVQSFTYFRQFSVPGSFNDWTSKTHVHAQPRREEACVSCAVKDWLENRYMVYLFKDAIGTTSWSKHFYATDLVGTIDSKEENQTRDSNMASCVLLVEENGHFCFGPRDKVHEILNVQRYIEKWPRIPAAELHASSIEHPDDPAMRWLLHTRRIICCSQTSTDCSGVCQPAGSLPPSAGVGNKESFAWMCKSCIEHLCIATPKMPPLALANSFFLGRHHPVFREATLATRMLASSGRLLMRQLFLGRGAPEESHKGMTGNTMLIAQPSPSYDQVLPNLATLTDSMVVLFCKSVDDVSKAQVLVVNREDYRSMVYHRQQVCPVFASAKIDEAAINKLPENAVPDVVIKNATHMPETENVKTVIHGPANRIPICSRDAGGDDDAETSGEETLLIKMLYACILFFVLRNDIQESSKNCDGGKNPANDANVYSHHGATNSGQDHPAGAPSEDKLGPVEEMNEHETVIAVDPESMPEPLRLFDALHTNLDLLSTQAAKFAQAQLEASNGGNIAEAVVKQTGAKELVAGTIAVSLPEIAKKMIKSNKQNAEWQKLVAAADGQAATALAVPTGKPLSIFDCSALPAAYTEFLFGDCVPFLERETLVTCEQIFDALPNREELEYRLPEDSSSEPYKAATRSRFDSPEFYAVFSSFLRTLKLFQSTRAALDRPGFEKDLRTITTATSEDFVAAALHESKPRTNADLMNTAGNERVKIALRHLSFSTATVPLTDGYKMRCHHLGTAMNRVFGALTVFHTQNYADNYSPEILTLHGRNEHVSGRIQNIPMPTLQEMHKLTAASPRATAKYFMLLEELAYRHLYRVDRAKLGHFQLKSPLGNLSREDDFVSNGFCGLAGFATAVFKCLEAQARGFAHGHGKVHSIPGADQGLVDSMNNVIDEINKLRGERGDTGLADEDVNEILKREMAAYNERLIGSACTRQYESAMLPAKQLGQIVKMVPFSEKQQRQSRFDGGLEEDGKTPRPLHPVVPEEPPAHIAGEQRRADAAQDVRRSYYREVPLTGCQLCTAPHYLLPNSFGRDHGMGEEGEVDDSDASPLPGLPWVFESGTGKLKHFLADVSGNIASNEMLKQDACVFEKHFARDVRFLHHHCHDHDCSTTCVKNVKKKTKEQLRGLLKSNRAPPCRFDFYHVVQFDNKGKLTRIRRRGKEIVDKPRILAVTSRNQFGLVAVERPHPFRSASSDCGLATLRCNNDFKFMARGFPDSDVLKDIFRCDVDQLATCFSKHKGMIKKYPSVSRMTMTIVAIHTLAAVVDYYITKYAAKPMEQLQNLTTQYALGMKRLEEKYKEEEKLAENTRDVHPGDDKDAMKKRSWRVLVALQNAANRSKWISSTECALFVHHGALHWTSHNEVPMFVSRPIFLGQECKRMLTNSKVTLTKPRPCVDISVIEFQESRGVARSAINEEASKMPPGIPNIGNTCFANALLQCCRELLSRLPSDLMPQTDRCPLAPAMQATSFQEHLVKQWPFWAHLPIGVQRDASEVLEMWFDPRSAMHQDCDESCCYGVLFQAVASHRILETTSCNNCEHVNKDTQLQSILRTSPHGGIQTSLSRSLAADLLCDFQCPECGHNECRRATNVFDLSRYLIVHVSKPQAGGVIWAESSVDVLGTNFKRVAVVHRTGWAIGYGHYTATVSTEKSTFHFDDKLVTEQKTLGDASWLNTFLVFYERTDFTCGNEPTSDPIEIEGDGSEHFVESVTCNAEHDGDDRDDDNVSEDLDNSEGEEDTRPKLEAVGLRTTTSRYDDWLHRGPLLAELSWVLYMMHVVRISKPRRRLNDYTDLFYFDDHYALSTLYCQKVVSKGGMAIPRLVGCVCPPPEEDDGEGHALYKLMLFSRTRCPGKLGCADPMLCRSWLIPNEEPNDAETWKALMQKYKRNAAAGEKHTRCKKDPPKFRPSWKAAKCEINMRAKAAIDKEHRARKIAVIADTTTMKDRSGDNDPSVVRARCLRPTLFNILISCFNAHAAQMPHGLVYLVDYISRFVTGTSCYDLSEQLHMVEFAALQMQKYNEAVDIDILVRKKPFRDENDGSLVNDVDSEDEDEGTAGRLYTEFLGGGGESDCDEIDETEGDLAIQQRPMKKCNLGEAKAMLARTKEVEHANAPGRTKEADGQMKTYAMAFAHVLQTTMPAVSHTQAPPPPSLRIDVAVNFQKCVAKEMRGSENKEMSGADEDVDVDLLKQMKIRNTAKDDAQCVILPLQDRMLGPGHVARKLMQNMKDDAGKHFEFNDEQINCIALQIWPLEQAWRKQFSGKETTDPKTGSVQMLPPDLGLPRVVIIGGGGCGKTTIMQLVIVPTLRMFFKRVLLTAPSNRAARGFDPSAKTMHSIAGMKPEDSMRTSNLGIKSDRMRKRMDANQTHAGAWIHDEALQTSAPLLHATSLRSTYARQNLYNLDIARYAQPSEIMGRISVFIMCGDHLQLPPVPKSSGLLASLENTSDEHKTGASMFNNVHYLFEMHTMKRFKDPILISILNKMRTAGGQKLSDQEWSALKNTEVNEDSLRKDPTSFIEETMGWYESCYLWSIVSMASYTRSMISATRAKQILYYCQAVDVTSQIAGRSKIDMEVYDRMLAVPSVAKTKRLPGWVTIHHNMRVRLTTQILPPWAVQDATGVIVDIDLTNADRNRLQGHQNEELPAEMVLHQLPHGVYVKLDNCNQEFLPPVVCDQHKVAGFCKECTKCRSFEGWICVQPMTRKWSFLDPVEGATLQVRRTQLPLMPEAACPLYSLQGATCDPGLIAHFIMPKRADSDIKWLIVYVMLSRVRSLSCLRSIGMSPKIRNIIEEGPPHMLAENFERIFRKKIIETNKKAVESRQALGWD